MWRPDQHADQLSDRDARELEALDLILAAGPGAEPDPGSGGDSDQARLARLVQAVRDDRPPLRPAFADELGLRVSTGFARRSGGRGPANPDSSSESNGVRGRRARAWIEAARWPARRQWLVGLGAAASLAVGGVVVAGIVPSKPSTLRPQAASGSVDAAAAPAGGQPTYSKLAPATGRSAPSIAPSPASSATASAGPAAPATPAIGGARAVESDASLALLAPRGQVQKVADETIAATDRLGGIVESSHVTLGDQGGSQATLALAVPSPALERTLAAISSLAHVSARSQDTLDITDPTQVARARLSESRTERIALLRQLGTATTAGQVASVHAQLGLVDGRIAKDEASLQALVRHAATATVNVTIDEAARAAAPNQGGGDAGGSPWRPARALHAAVGVLEAVFAVLVIGLAGLIPAAGVAFLVWWALEVVRRRRRQATLARVG